MGDIPLIYKMFALAAATALIYASGYAKGKEAEVNHQAVLREQAQQKGIKQEQQAAAVTQQIDAKHASAVAEQRVVYRNIEKEVVRYVTKTEHPACTLPTGWVRLHDAAATGQVPSAPGESDGQASGATADDALGVVTRNYETCHATRQQLIYLQNWITEQEKVHEKD